MTQSNRVIYHYESYDRTLAERFARVKFGDEDGAPRVPLGWRC